MGRGLALDAALLQRPPLGRLNRPDESHLPSAAPKGLACALMLTEAEILTLLADLASFRVERTVSNGPRKGVANEAQE